MPSLVLPIGDTAEKTQSHFHGTDTLKGKNGCLVNNDRTALKNIVVVFFFFLRQGLFVAQIGLKLYR